jgi:hypothetical protein
MAVALYIFPVYAVAECPIKVFKEPSTIHEFPFTAEPAQFPNAVFEYQLSLFISADSPIATLSPHVSFALRADHPIAVLFAPLVLLPSAQEPIAVL